MLMYTVYIVQVCELFFARLLVLKETFFYSSLLLLDVFIEPLGNIWILDEFRNYTSSIGPLFSYMHRCAACCIACILAYPSRM